MAEELMDARMRRATFLRLDPQILAWMMNDAGCFSSDPALIKPELIAHINRLLTEMGVIHPLNLHTIAEKLMEAANNNDIAAIEKSRI